MPQVVIVGAGPLGGELAFLLARRDAVGSIAIVDEVGTIAAGKALDIRQSAPIERFSTQVSGTTDLFVAAGAPVVVLADTAAGGEWQGDAAAIVLQRLARAGSPSVFVCAGATHAGLVERAVREFGVDRTRVLGTAPEALVSATRAITALEAGRSPSEVTVAVLGVPPDRVVIPWEEATIGGFGASRLLDEPARRRVAARLNHLWPPGPLALAAAAAKAVTSVLGRSRRSVCAFVAPDDRLGRKMRAGAVPVVLGPWGIERVELPPLSGHDQVALDTALLL